MRWAILLSAKQEASLGKLLAQMHYRKSFPIFGKLQAEPATGTYDVKSRGPLVPGP